MKKPHQTKAARIQDSARRAERRNYQKGPTKKGAAVPEYVTEPIQPTKPTPPTCARSRKRHRLKVQPGQPSGRSKLTAALSKELCDLIRQQATLEDAAAKCHIGRETIWEWRTRGQQNEHPCYVAFECAISEALIDAKQKLVTGIADDKDIRGKLFLLKNRYPKEYRDRIVQEVSGPDGEPLVLPSANPYTVVIELTAQPAGVAQQQSEKSFELQEVTDERWQW